MYCGTFNKPELRKLSTSKAGSPLITLVNILDFGNIPDDVKMHEYPFFPWTDLHANFISPINLVILLVILTLNGELWSIKENYSP